MTDEEKAAAEAEAKKKAEEERKAKEAAEAAAELARRKAEKERERAEEGGKQPWAAALHDVRQELLAEVKKAGDVRHAVPSPSPAPAQKRSGGVLSGIVGAVLVLVVLAVLAAFGSRYEGDPDAR